MTFDLAAVLESKRALRRHLAAAPIGEKLRLLDALREREVALRRTGRQMRPTTTTPPGPWADGRSEPAA